MGNVMIPRRTTRLDTSADPLAAWLVIYENVAQDLKFSFFFHVTSLLNRYGSRLWD